MLFTGIQLNQPSAVRYPRGAGPGVAIEQAMTAIPIGKAKLVRSGQRIAVLAFGSLVAPALAVGDALDLTVVNMRFVKPIDTEMIAELAKTHDAFVTVEEHVVMGGAGSACLEAMAALDVQKPVLNLGLPDRFIDHGDHQQLLGLEGLNAQGIEASIRARFGHMLAQTAPRLVSIQ